MKHLLVVLLIPTALLGIGCGMAFQADFVDVQQQHPDWPPEISSLVADKEVRVGMTIDQVECALGTNSVLQHAHLLPTMSVGRPNGTLYRTYTLELGSRYTAYKKLMVRYEGGLMASWKIWYF